MAMVPEGPAQQAVFWGQSSGTGLGPMWVYQRLEHSFCAAWWAPISRVQMARNVFDRRKVGGRKAKRGAEALNGPTRLTVFRGQSSRWSLGRVWLGRMRWPAMELLEDG